MRILQITTLAILATVRLAALGFADGDTAAVDQGSPRTVPEWVPVATPSRPSDPTGSMTAGDHPESDTAVSNAGWLVDPDSNAAALHQVGCESGCDHLSSFSPGYGSGMSAGTCGGVGAAGCFPDEGMFMRGFDTVFIHADLLFLGRDVDDLQLVGRDAGVQTFEESLSHGFEPGFRIHSGLRLWGNGFIETRHAIADGWDARGDFAVDPAVPSAISVRGNFTADYYSGDVNLVAEDPINSEGQLILGLRWIEHDDAFDIALNDNQAPPNTESSSAEASNSMFGIQAGFRTGWIYRRSIWNLSLLGGVLNNQISQRGPRYDNAIAFDGTDEPMFSVEDDEVSMFADIEGSIAYPILRSTYVRVGYQGVFMDNAVTVTRQQGSPASPDAIEFHGGFVGLEIVR